MQPIATISPKLSDSTQTISFSDCDGVNSVEVYSKDVLVTTNAGSHKHGSSKVKLKNVVDYNWEHKFTNGQLLALHMSGKYLAYAIKVASSINPGTWNSMIRVTHRLIDKRALIKGMKGEVQDLSFAHIDEPVMLACIDEYGHVYIHTVDLIDDCLRCTLMVEIVEDGLPAGGTEGWCWRAVWCPYVPDDEQPDEPDDDDVAYLLVTTHGNSARLLHVRNIVSGCSAGAGTARAASALVAGGAGGGGGGCALAVHGHTAPVHDAAFSPDGTALATAAHDGYVMFFQVYMVSDKTPRCLHKWQPHGGAPLSLLAFLDNHNNHNVDITFWKFAVTGAEGNSVLKIWSCKSWACLQTVRFAPPPTQDLALSTGGGLKAVVDASASYVVVSEQARRALYVLRVVRDADETTAHCGALHEFLLPFPVLSFAVLDAGEQAVKCVSSCGDPYHRNGNSGNNGDAALSLSHSPLDFDLHDDELENGSECGEGGAGGEGGGCVTRACLRLYVVQPRALQEARLLLAPPPRHQHAPPALDLPLSELMPALEELALEEGGGGAGVIRPTDSDVSVDVGVGVDVGVAVDGDVAAHALNAHALLHQQTQQLQNLLMRSQTQPGALLGQRPDSPSSVVAPQLNLMTPDAFSSPGKREEEDPPLSATPDVSVSVGVTVNAEALGTVSVPAAPPAPPPGYMTEEAGESVLEPKFTSAGSSPSREVQEILSLNEGSFYKEELDGSSQSAEDTPKTGDDHDQLYDDIDAPKETKWPPISMAKINEANQRKASSDKTASQSLNQSLNSSALVDVSMNDAAVESNSDDSKLASRLDQLAVLSMKEKQRVDALEDKLEKIMELLSEQNRLVRSLRNETVNPREQIEELLHAHTQHTTMAIENALTTRWKSVVEAGGRCGEAAGAAAARAAGAGAARSLEPLAHALQAELAAKLTATDTLLRDNIHKLATSKSVAESIGCAVAAALQGGMRDAFKEALAQSLVPAMERAHNQLFKQINNAFQHGTKEFAANTEAAARAAAERGGAAAASSLRAALERHADALAQATAAAASAQHAPPPPPAPAAHQLGPLVHDAVRSVLEQEMGRWREQAASMLEVSRSHSPATPSLSHTSMDRQVQASQISSLINAGEVNNAFQMALSASDLSLVVLACQKADVTRVFSPTCKLKQHVLMSLVQQLAADMAHDTQLKYRYLEEAVMNLDANNPVTRQHMPVVMRELQKQLSAFLTAQPQNSLARQLRMLLMATESLVKNATG